jgi:phosphoserine phosphatase
MMIIASDLNGTLTTGAPALAVTEWIKSFQPENYPWLYKYRLLLSYLQVRFGWMEIDIWADRILREVLSQIDSPNLDTLNAVMEYVVETQLWPNRRQEVVSFLHDFYQKGAEIYVISAAYEPAVKRFAQKIGDERVFGIGTPVYITPSGMVLADDLTTRKIKLDRLSELIGSQKLDIALGDTISDIPLLELAERPIAVYPDRELRHQAVINGWEILEKSPG